MSDQHKLEQTFNEKGETISPVLADGVKNFLIDIDGTVCDDVPNEEPERMGTVLPFPDALKILNKWYDEGHIITFFTSRTEEHRVITEEWLQKHNFKYHGLLMEKPRGGNYHWLFRIGKSITRHEKQIANRIFVFNTVHASNKLTLFRRRSG